MNPKFFLFKIAFNLGSNMSPSRSLSVKNILFMNIVQNSEHLCYVSQNQKIDLHVRIYFIPLYDIPLCLYSTRIIMIEGSSIDSQN